MAFDVWSSMLIQVLCEPERRGCNYDQMVRSIIKVRSRPLLTVRKDFPSATDLWNQALEASGIVLNETW
jgi:hypothetical protein